jgi:integrase
VRDRCLILIGFAGAFRRAELAQIRLRDVRYAGESGLCVEVRTSKAGREGTGLTKSLPMGSSASTCAVCVIVDWIGVLAAWERGRPEVMRFLRSLEMAEHRCAGAEVALTRLDPALPLFRPVMRNGVPKPRAISGNVVNDVVKRRVLASMDTSALEGLDADERRRRERELVGEFGAHSLRAGFVTTALTAGLPYHEVMRQTGHTDQRTVETYAHDRTAHVDNAVFGIGL